MSQAKLENIFEEAVKLPYKNQLTLIVKLAFSLKTSQNHPRHKLLELQGLGKEIWQHVDIEKYIDDLRNDWDE